MPIFKQQFNVHAVGQGLFYSGRVTLNRQAFTMAFDCGSYNAAAIEREITHFEDIVLDGSNELSLLVISHFDEDHVNHIADLLRKVKRVDKLIMPFLTFEERLVLVARLVARRGGYKTGDDGLISFMLDPLSLLSKYLDGDSSVYLVDHEPGPIRPVGGSNERSGGEENQSLSEGGDLSFDFTSKISIGNADWRLLNYSVPRAQLYKVTDAGKGLLSQRYVELMEFLFYKRSLGGDEKKFYQLVAEYFKAHYGIKRDDVDTIVGAVKTITNAKEIKKIFRKAARECRIPLSKAENLNTTALCMLHRDLGGVFNFRWWAPVYQMRHYFSDHTAVYRTAEELPFFYYLESYHPFSPFPNVLLTSDTFLSSVAEMREFDEKYTPYFKDIWLFQLPHHGSVYNIREDFFLDNRYRAGLAYFVNHGVKNRSKHPDPEVLEWAQAVVPHRQMRLINELNGMEFSLRLS